MRAAAALSGNNEVKKTVKTIFLVLGCLFLIYTLFHSSQIEQEILAHYKYYRFMKGKAPIVDLKLDSSNCTEDQTFLANWRGLSLCIQRNKDFSYTGSSECPEGYKLCNPGLCVNESEACPITRLSILYNEATGLINMELERLSEELPILHMVIANSNSDSERANVLNTVSDGQIPFWNDTDFVELDSILLETVPKGNQIEPSEQISQRLLGIRRRPLNFERSYPARVKTSGLYSSLAYLLVVFGIVLYLLARIFSEDSSEPCQGQLHDGFLFIMIWSPLNDFHFVINGELLSASLTDFPQYSIRILWARGIEYAILALLIWGLIKHCKLAHELLKLIEPKPFAGYKRFKDSGLIYKFVGDTFFYTLALACDQVMVQNMHRKKHTSYKLNQRMLRAIDVVPERNRLYCLTLYSLQITDTITEKHLKSIPCYLGLRKLRLFAYPIIITKGGRKENYYEIYEFIDEKKYQLIGMYCGIDKEPILSTHNGQKYLYYPTVKGWRGLNLSQKTTIVLNRDPNQIPLTIDESMSKMISYDKIGIYETDLLTGETQKRLEMEDLLSAKVFEDQIFLLLPNRVLESVSRGSLRTVNSYLLDQEYSEIIAIYSQLNLRSYLPLKHCSLSLYSK